MERGLDSVLHSLEIVFLEIIFAQISAQLWILWNIPFFSLWAESKQSDIPRWFSNDIFFKHFFKKDLEMGIVPW